MTALVVALAVAVLLLAVLVAGLLRSHAEILKALHELGAGLELDRSEGPVDVTIEGVRTPRRGSSETADAIAARRSTARPSRCRSPPAPTPCWPSCPPAAPPAGVLGGLRRAGRGGARRRPAGRRHQGLDEESASALAKRAAARPARVEQQRWEGFGVPGRRTSSTSTAPGASSARGSAATWPAVATLMGQAHADDAHRTGRLTARGADDAALAAAGIRPGDPSL
jgi:hypothetical protein